MSDHLWSAIFTVIVYCVFIYLNESLQSQILHFVPELILFCFAFSSRTDVKPFQEGEEVIPSSDVSREEYVCVISCTVVNGDLRRNKKLNMFNA